MSVWKKIFISLYEWWSGETISFKLDLKIAHCLSVTQSLLLKYFAANIFWIVKTIYNNFKIPIINLCIIDKHPHNNWVPPSINSTLLSHLPLKYRIKWANNSQPPNACGSSFKHLWWFKYLYGYILERYSQPNCLSFCQISFNFVWKDTDISHYWLMIWADLVVL